MLKYPDPSNAKKSDNNSPLLAALKCAYHFMQQRIISNPKDLMGILLFGTEATKFYDEGESRKGGYSFPHCYLLTDLNVPEADDVKALKELVEDNATSRHEAFVPSEEPVNMPHVLFCANQIFQQRAPNFSSRRLFIVTDNDNPHPNEKALRNGAATRAKDLYDLGVELELFPISSANHTFDTSLFYDDIIYRKTPSDADAIDYNPSSHVDGDRSTFEAGSSEGISLLQKLLKSIASKSTPKRALFSSVPLELAPNFRISVKGYLLYKRQTPARSCYIYLGLDRPQIVKGNAVQQTDDGTEPIEKGEIRKAFKFGGEDVLFTLEETKVLRDFGEPIIRIIGFRPAEKLPFWANIKHSTFIYPSEEDFVGSTRVFSALYAKLLKSKLMALTWFIPRRNAAPVMAALIPTLPAPAVDSTSNLTGTSGTGAPQGLHLIPLPFADDVRQPPSLASDEPVIAPDELVDAMRPIVQQLNLPKGIYDPSKYPNPSLQWHYRILQALALDEDVPVDPEDKTRPKYRQIDKRVHGEIEDWQATLGKCYKSYVAEHPQTASFAHRAPKRGLNDDASDVKKIKSETSGDVTSEAEVRKLWQRGAIASLTVSQLKAFLDSKKMAMTGRKSELVDRIEAWFEKK